MTAEDPTPRRPSKAEPKDEPLYFFPEEPVTDDELRRLLAEGELERRAWAVSHLLRFAQWDDIWHYIDRDQVREIFPQLDLPESLRQAWARMLKLEQPVS